MPFSLKIDNKVSPDKPPSFEAQLAAGREIMGADLSSWIEGKTFHDGKIRTFFKKATSGGHGWHMRDVINVINFIKRRRGDAAKKAAAAAVLPSD
ncbi:hypothetical protein FRC02_011201 [Tulasnella sp. 418]|nr:hypothetical protein FRC02_011201 [Tulasnella sp. 418]